jgi:hypothetical protein
MRGHFRKAPDDGQVRPKRIVSFIHIILYNNNNNNNNNNNRVCLLWHHTYIYLK